MIVLGKKQKTGVLISARLDFDAQMAVAMGCWPKKDFIEIARALQGDIIDHSLVEETWYWRVLRSIVGMPVTQAFIAFVRRGQYEQIFSDGEHIGIPLALLLRLSRQPIRHVMIGHLLTTTSKRLVFRFLHPERRIDSVLLHSSLQEQLAARDLGFGQERIKLIPYQADTVFWRARETMAAEPIIATAGLEYRDYATLIDAVKGLPVRLVIAAGSRWSRHQAGVKRGELPPNVEIVSLDYCRLRELYGRSRFVVVPLRPIDNQAGVTTVLEAMAMGKAVVVTATPGQCDVVRGRLWTDTGPGFTQGGPSGFGLDRDMADRETGVYVVPNAPIALRRAIEDLLADPERAARMGQAGRELVEQTMNLEAFVERVAQVVDPTPRMPALANG